MSTLKVRTSCGVTRDLAADATSSRLARGSGGSGGDRILRLAEKDTPPERLEVDAVCTLDDQKLKIMSVALDVRGAVTGMSEEEFEKSAREAEQLCPVSNALRGNLEIQLQTHQET